MNTSIQHRSGLEPLWSYDISNAFMTHFWLTYGSPKWTDVVQRGKAVDIGESVRTYIMKTLIYSGVYYFTEQSEGTI